MNESGEYSAPPYYREFGSWNDALRAAGLKPNATRKPRSDDELLAELERVAEACGGTPTQADLTEYDVPSPDTYRARFGSWNAALEAAGFTPRRSSSRTPTEELCTALQELANELEHRPTTSDMNQHGEFSAGTYVNRFGSWSDALDAAGFDTDTDGTRIPTEELSTTLQELAAELDRPPTTTDMAQRGPHSPSTYINRFGSWEAALTAADLSSQL